MLKLVFWNVFSMSVKVFLACSLRDRIIPDKRNYILAISKISRKRRKTIETPVGNLKNKQSKGWQPMKDYDFLWKMFLTIEY